MSDVTIIPTATDLTTPEATRLGALETVIDRGMKTFVEVGNALAEIRDNRLYRATHRTFEEYCRERWGIKRSHAKRLMASAETTKNLAPIGATAIPCPANEAQVRPLTKLPPEEQPAAWAEATENAQSEGRRVTAKDVEAVVAKRKEANSQQPTPTVETEVPTLTRHDPSEVTHNLPEVKELADSTDLHHLKLRWRTATKKDKVRFLDWMWQKATQGEKSHFRRIFDADHARSCDA